MTTEEFLRYVCPNHTDTSKWNKSELLHILELHAEQLHKHAVMPSCEGNCGMNYCDDNGCIERKRILVEPKGLPEHEA